MMRLTDCKTAEEIRKNFPQLYSLAEMIERTPDPARTLKVVAWIITRKNQQ